MDTLLDFQFVVILNLLICIAWQGTGPYMGTRTVTDGARTDGTRWSSMNAVSIIMLILVVLAVILDIVFLAGGHAH